MSRKTRAATVAIGLILGVLLGGVAYAQDPPPKPALGQPAGELALPDLKGNMVRLSDYLGSAVLITFWTTW